MKILCKRTLNNHKNHQSTCWIGRNQPFHQSQPADQGLHLYFSCPGLSWQKYRKKHTQSFLVFGPVHQTQPNWNLECNNCCSIARSSRFCSVLPYGIVRRNILVHRFFGNLRFEFWQFALECHLARLLAAPCFVGSIWRKYLPLTLVCLFSILSPRNVVGKISNLVTVQQMIRCI